jgi:hypothetical protein
MSLQWKVSHLDHMVICVSEGVVTLGDFQEYLAALKKENALPFRKIFIATEGRSGMSVDDRKKLAVLLTNFLETEGLGPFAVVAGVKRNSELAEVFKSLSTVRRPMRLFPDIHAARKWLGTRSTVRSGKSGEQS